MWSTVSFYLSFCNAPVSLYTLRVSACGTASTSDGLTQMFPIAQAAASVSWTPPTDENTSTQPPLGLRGDVIATRPSIQ